MTSFHVWLQIFLFHVTVSVALGKTPICKAEILSSISIAYMKQLIHILLPSRFSSVQLLSCVRLFETPLTAAGQASVSITNSWSSPKVMSIQSVMPSNHLILCCPPLLPPSIFSSLRVFSNESVLRVRWPKYWSFSFQ